MKKLKTLKVNTKHFFGIFLIYFPFLSILHPHIIDLRGMKIQFTWENVNLENGSDYTHCHHHSWASMSVLDLAVSTYLLLDISSQKDYWTGPEHRPIFDLWQWKSSQFQALNAKKQRNLPNSSLQCEHFFLPLTLKSLSDDPPWDVPSAWVLRGGTWGPGKPRMLVEDVGGPGGISLKIQKSHR